MAEINLVEAVNLALAWELAHAEQVGPPALETMFDDVYAELTPQLREQRAYLMASPRAKQGHGA